MAKGRVRAVIYAHSGLWIERVDTDCYIGGQLGSRYETFPYDKVFLEIFLDSPTKGCLYHSKWLPSLGCIKDQKFYVADITKFEKLGEPYFYFSVPGKGAVVKVNAANCRKSGSPGAGEWWVAPLTDKTVAKSVISKVKDVDPSIPDIGNASGKEYFIDMANKKLILLEATYVDYGQRSRTIPIRIFSDCRAYVKYFVVGSGVERAASIQVEPGGAIEVPITLQIPTGTSSIGSDKKYLVLTWDYEFGQNKVCRIYAGLSEDKYYAVAEDLSKVPPPVAAALLGARYELGPKLIADISISARDRCVEGYAEVGLGDAVVTRYKTKVKVCPEKKEKITAELNTGGKLDSKRKIVFVFSDLNGRKLFEASWDASVSFPGANAPKYILNADKNGVTFTIENLTKSALDEYYIFQINPCLREERDPWGAIKFSDGSYYQRHSIAPLARKQITFKWSDVNIDPMLRCLKSKSFHKYESTDMFCVRVMRGVQLPSGIVDAKEELAKACFKVVIDNTQPPPTGQKNCVGPSLDDVDIGFCGAPAYESGNPKFVLNSFDQKFSLEIIAIPKTLPKTEQKYVLRFRPGLLLVGTNLQFTAGQGLSGVPQNVPYSERTVTLTLRPGALFASAKLEVSPRDFLPQGIPEGFKRDEFAIQIYLGNKQIGVIWVEVKGTVPTPNTNVSPQKYYTLKPESGRRTVPKGGLFLIDLDTNDTGEYELGLKLGIGLDAESAKKSATEVELVDARGRRGKRHKVRGKIRLALKLPEKLPAEICIYMQPIINGLPKDDRIYCFV